VLLAVLVSVATPFLSGFTYAPAVVSAEQLPTDDALRTRNDVIAVHDSEPWVAALAQASIEFDIPLPVLRAVLSVESGGDPEYINAATGATGLMQVRPEIAAAASTSYGHDLTSPATNIRTAAESMRRAYDQFGNWDLAYAAFSGAINLDRSTPAYRDPADFGDVARFRESLAAQGYIQNPAAVNGTALDWAFEALGTPYLWAGVTLDGFDCSGLVYWAYQQVGVTLPRGSAAQWDATTRITAEELQPGDIIFFGADLFHVGLYAGNGYMLHSPREGMTVEIVSLSESYWSSNVVGYGRVR
jgi:cell wall-associated NlpC family hydrolase